MMQGEQYLNRGLFVDLVGAQDKLCHHQLFNLPSADREAPKMLVLQFHRCRPRRLAPIIDSARPAMCFFDPTQRNLHAQNSSTATAFHTCPLPNTYAGESLNPSIQREVQLYRE